MPQALTGPTFSSNGNLALQNRIRIYEAMVSASSNAGSWWQTTRRQSGARRWSAREATGGMVLTRRTGPAGAQLFRAR